MIRNMVFYFGILVVGVLVLLFSRSLGTYEDEEEKWKEEFWFRELIFGPPGYPKATGIILGVLLIIIGLAGAISVLFFS